MIVRVSLCPEGGTAGVVIGGVVGNLVATGAGVAVGAGVGIAVRVGVGSGVAVGIGVAARVEGAVGEGIGLNIVVGAGVGSRVPVGSGAGVGSTLGDGAADVVAVATTAGVGEDVDAVPGVSVGPAAVSWAVVGESAGVPAAGTGVVLSAPQARVNMMVRTTISRGTVAYIPPEIVPNLGRVDIQVISRTHRDHDHHENCERTSLLAMMS